MNPLIIPLNVQRQLLALKLDHLGPGIVIAFKHHAVDEAETDLVYGQLYVELQYTEYQQFKANHEERTYCIDNPRQAPRIKYMTKRRIAHSRRRDHVSN